MCRGYKAHIRKSFLLRDQTKMLCSCEFTSASCTQMFKTGILKALPLGCQVFLDYYSKFTYLFTYYFNNLLDKQ